MALEEYPKIINEEESLVTFVQRIIAIREDDISQLNEILRLSSYNSGFTRQTNAVSSDTDIGSTDLYNDIDATSGAVTVDLNPNPTNGDTHYFAKLENSGNAVTVDGNGKNINGSASLSLTSQYDTMMVVYMGAADEWRRFI
jgi:hypothetical protein